MADAPYHHTLESSPEPHAAAPRKRSLGEHVFIWIAWALAAAFWGASMTVFAGILRDAGQATPGAPAAPGAPGGLGYLVFVVAAFVVLTAAMLYGSLRTAGTRRFEPRTQAATADLYDRIEHEGGGE